MQFFKKIFNKDELYRRRKWKKFIFKGEKLADKTCGLFKNILFSCVKTNVAFTALHNVKDFVLNAGRIINSKINVCMTTTKIKNY